MRKTIFILSLLNVVSTASFAQKEYTREEGIEFANLAVKTKEYIAAKQRADSFNLDEANVPQRVKFEITYDKNNVSNDIYLDGTISRTLFGMSIESYSLLYDRAKRKIVSIKGGIDSSKKIEVIRKK